MDHNQTRTDSGDLAEAEQRVNELTRTIDESLSIEQRDLLVKELEEARRRLQSLRDEAERLR